jgi:glycosyltransferase involved in cell wall biosynthesis
MKLNIKDSEIMFIYTGKITPSKNIKILFEALNYLKNKGNGNFRMAIIGEGPDSYIKELKDFAQIHGIDDFILWHDMVLNKDLAPYYSAADVGVWPREASATILEAMSCNLPIILSDFSKVTFLVSHDNGYLFKDGNAIDLSGKMELLLKNELRIQMGKNSRKIIEEKYNWTIIAKKFLDL